VTQRLIFSEVSSAQEQIRQPNPQELKNNNNNYKIEAETPGQYAKH
jgi:hypothetical protein